MDIPKDYPVQPLKPEDKAKDRVTCGTCGLSWDDGMNTSLTPTPSARCPFESFHEESYMLYRVWSLDVWGHSSGDCEQPHQPGCAMLIFAENTNNVTCDCDRHDHCEGYFVNDRCSVGTIEVPEGATDAEIVSLLVSEGFLKDGVTLQNVDIEDMGDDLYVNEVKDGKPVFQLECKT